MDMILFPRQELRCNRTGRMKLERDDTNVLIKEQEISFTQNYKFSGIRAQDVHVDFAKTFVSLLFFMNLFSGVERVFSICLLKKLYNEE